MLEVSAETEIDAPAEAVWRVLTDLDQFHAWNPFIRDARGDTSIGGEVHVRVRPSMRVPLHFRANITTSEPPHELRWHGHLLADWLASGEHVFSIEQIDDDHVRFVQRETFSGVLPWLAARLLAREARRGFVAMNRALDARVHELGGAR